MSSPWNDHRAVTVALRKESVDRNSTAPVFALFSHESLSARRAWIEIASVGARRLLWGVALRKESVDRNTLCGVICCLWCSRSPQGERG